MRIMSDSSSVVTKADCGVNVLQHDQKRGEDRGDGHASILAHGHGGVKDKLDIRKNRF
jgi:hypothetical protein